MPTLFCDLGGVLFTDPAPAPTGAAVHDEALRLDDDHVRAFEAGALGEAEFALHLRAALAWTGSDDDLVAAWTRPAPVLVLDVLDLLSGLHERGWTLIGADDVDPWRARARADQYGWALSTFDRVVSSAEAGARRPDPRFFAELRRGAPRGGARLYVDDDPQNVSAARRAGLDAHLFTSVAALTSICRDFTPAPHAVTPPVQATVRLPDTAPIAPPA